MAKPHTEESKYPKILLAIYILFWILLAFGVYDRSDWWLENILPFVFIPLLIYTYNKFRLSNVSYTLIFIFMMLHTIGSHYTYAEVPLGYWMMQWFGFGRNHFDRIVHFSFGFLLAYPIREVFLRIANAKGFWGYYLPLDVTLSFSALYEIMEWVTAAVVAPSAGVAFLGSQGDIWDAQKDMALAGIGATLAMIVIAMINWHLDSDFGKKIWRSFKVKNATPLGEVKLKELEKRRKR